MNPGSGGADQPESPVGLRLSLDKTRESFTRIAGDRLIGKSRVERESTTALGCEAGPTYPCIHVLGVAATTCTAVP